jgi:hypothetical protein
MRAFDVTIPTGAIIPPLLAAFGMLAFEHYRANPKQPVADIRFLMMAAAVLMMGAQLIFGGETAWLSPALLGLALVWVAVAGALVIRRLRAR